jgi:hypothetical protein
VRNATLTAVVIELLTLGVKLAGPFRPRYLVIQTKAAASFGPDQVIYAQVFYRRSSAEKAAKAANERVRTFGPRRYAGIAKLPLDRR